MYQKQIFKTKRGKLSDLMWKLNIHGISTRRAFAGWHTSKERRKKTLTKIIETMLNNFQNNQNPNQKELAQSIECSTKTIERYELAQSIECSTKTIERYENDYNLKSIVFLQWHKANKANTLQEKNNAKKIDIRPFVQTKLLESLQSTFSVFSPSSAVETLDFRRKGWFLGFLGEGLG
jgi:DNA-binding XRE family transcriptional regulator